MGSQLPPLVLLHGLAMSGDVWHDTAPLLATHHRVFTPSALGHRGGPPVQRHPVTIWDVIDAAERYLDEQGLDRPHLAGNSMGGFVAVELARRGRAASVCAISPGGFWSDDFRAHVIKNVRRGAAIGRVMRPITPLMMRSARVRRRALSNATMRGDLIAVGRAVGMANDTLNCSVVADIQTGSDEHVALMDPLPCPITIAWAELDPVLPVETCGALARERLPGAAFTVLPDLGHVPMLDDPGLVARTILTTTTGV